ncbi:MAG: adenosylmethionine decarboxylase [Treponema sp.]|nr:adenosylmethionine decarboxylase [Treponema sp.]
MVKRVRGQKIELEGFNNLTKSLSFNIYDVCYARSTESQIEYLEYIDEEYNSKRLENIVQEITNIIRARLVNVSTQDYDPRGASVVALLNEDQNAAGNATRPRISAAPAVVGHLDTSHIAIHTYPEYNQLSGIATFRVDVDISTCGMISPLSVLNYLIESFESDVITINYNVRGFTRDSHGDKLFIDHDISSIQEYISEDVLDLYSVYDINIISDNVFHTKMRIKTLKLANFLFGDEVKTLERKEKKRIKKSLELEIQEIFESKNFRRKKPKKNKEGKENKESKENK